MWKGWRGNDKLPLKAYGEIQIGLKNERDHKKLSCENESLANIIFIIGAEMSKRKKIKGGYENEEKKTAF